MVEALAAQEPIWPPGTSHGYHMRTFGWLVGELVRRVDGGTAVGTFWREAIDIPLRPRLLDRLAGRGRATRRAPGHAEERHGRAAEAATAVEPVADGAFPEPRRSLRVQRHVEHPQPLHAAELPSSNGIGDEYPFAWCACTRRASAKSTACARWSVHRPLPRRNGRAGVRQGRSADERDLLRPRLHARRVVRRGEPAPRVLGHAGAGGSLSFAGSPEAGVGFGYVMNDLRFDPTEDPRSQRAGQGDVPLPRITTEPA